MNSYTVQLEHDEGGMWVAEIPEVPGCVSQGTTRAEALTNIREALTLCLEVRAEHGMPLRVETENLAVVEA